MHPSAAEFVAEARSRYDFEPAVEEFPEGTRTAHDAAGAIGCDVAQIASSIVLVADDEVVVSVTSGSNRVDTSKISALCRAETTRLASADEVKEATGWTIGGVPPFCHDTDLRVFLDDTLTDFETVWAAAGTPQAVFPVEPAQIIAFADAEIATVAE
ncbi:YbaK/EbsC family protein [Haloarchaeobius sp. TZWWS8]|uniref:YbaK/EbsC family protein n=1 Tax=Haloarchaeobius sp. TZWWS8 TaxID=3446121 RepID=UPI003EC0618D